MERLVFSMLFFASMSSMSAADSLFAGIWEGQTNGLPAIQLRIHDSGGKPDGDIVFYFQHREPNGPWAVKSEYPTPLLNVKAEVKTMTFEVRHHKSHGSSDFGPNVKFRLDRISEQELRLFKIDPGTERGMGLKLIRRK